MATARRLRVALALAVSVTLAEGGAAKRSQPAGAAAGQGGGDGWEEKVSDDGKVVQQLKIEAPSMTEEDQYGPVMPDRYKCDSCRAVMFHLDSALRAKQLKAKRMKDWEYTDVFDDTCRGAFSGYGIKLIDGENALSGPGLKQEEKLAPGSGAIQMSSETWSKRLGEICRKIVYETLGEDEVYDRFWLKYQAEQSGDDSDSLPGLTESLCARELRECHAGPKLPKNADGEVGVNGKRLADKKKDTKDKKAKKDKQDKKDADRKEKKAREADSKRTAKPPVSAPPAADGSKVDVNDFLRNLARRHGLAADEYLYTRTNAEWEKTFVSTASRIFNRVVDPKSDEGTCASNRWAVEG